MKVVISFALLLAAVISFDGDSEDDSGDGKKSRKHYGLSYHTACKDYVKTFTCMSACKSIGFQVFRMDFTCKCSCHELKTTTILPFFKWRTNGTTNTWARTKSPHLYHVAGTLSPATYPDYSDQKGNQTTPQSGAGQTTVVASANSTDAEGGAGTGADAGAGGGGAGGENAGEITAEAGTTANAGAETGATPAPEPPAEPNE